MGGEEGDGAAWGEFFLFLIHVVGVPPPTGLRERGAGGVRELGAQRQDGQVSDTRDYVMSSPTGPRFQTSFMALGRRSTAATRHRAPRTGQLHQCTCSRLVDARTDPLLNSTGRRSRAGIRSTSLGSLSYQTGPVRASSNEQRSGTG